MNRLERAILAVAPQWAEQRARSRIHVLAYNRAYEAAEPTRLRKRIRDHGSGNNAVQGSALDIRAAARNLDRNHDLVVGALNVLAQNVVGQSGIGIEPQPRNANGDVDEGLVDQIAPLWRDWCKRPEVTWSHDFASAQRLLTRTLFRDGECLHQDLVGPVPFLNHGSIVPYSIEMIEPDLLPLDYSDASRNIMQGVERNAWGRAVAYWLYKQHPGDPDVMGIPDIKRVSADLIRHARMIDRIGQVRGVSLLASVLTRLDDLKDYEESERIAAKIAACMAAFIIKGDPTLYDPAQNTDAEGHALPQRRMRFEPGMVFDDLRTGESVGTVDTQRPNSNLENYRNGQLRAVAAGMRVSFSSLSKNYLGTYSTQRQELVEQYGAYGILAYEVISQIVRPIYERFIRAAAASGELVLPRGFPHDNLIDAMYLPPSMPWIDPQKEAEAMQIMEDNAYMSGPEIIRRRGANPRDVLDQESAWQQRKREWGIAPRPAAAPTATPANEAIP